MVPGDQEWPPIDDLPRNRLKDILQADENASIRRGRRRECRSQMRAFGSQGFTHAAAGGVTFREATACGFAPPARPWQYSPSEGLLLKFSESDLLVLIAAATWTSRFPKVPTSPMPVCNATACFGCRNDPEEIERVGETGPTIDSVMWENVPAWKSGEWLEEGPGVLTSGEGKAGGTS